MPNLDRTTGASTADFLGEIRDAGGPAGNAAEEVAALIMGLDMLMRLGEDGGFLNLNFLFSDIIKETEGLMEILPEEFQPRKHLLENLVAIMAEQKAKRG